jgi:hypothetical protein
MQCFARLFVMRTLKSEAASLQREKEKSSSKFSVGPELPPVRGFEPYTVDHMYEDMMMFITRAHHAHERQH